MSVELIEMIMLPFIMLTTGAENVDRIITLDADDQNTMRKMAEITIEIIQLLRMSGHLMQ